MQTTLAHTIDLIKPFLLQPLQFRVLIPTFIVLVLSNYAILLQATHFDKLLNDEPDVFKEYNFEGTRFSRRDIIGFLTFIFMAVGVTLGFLLSTLLGILSDRRGRKKVLMGSMLMSAVGMSLMPVFLKIVPSLLVCSLLYAFQIPVMVIATASSLDMIHNPKTKLCIISFLLFSKPWSSLFTGDGSNEIIRLHGTAWRWDYWFPSILMLLLILVTWKVFPMNLQLAKQKAYQKVTESLHEEVPTTHSINQEGNQTGAIEIDNEEGDTEDKESLLKSDLIELPAETEVTDTMKANVEAVDYDTVDGIVYPEFDTVTEQIKNTLSDPQIWTVVFLYCTIINLNGTFERVFLQANDYFTTPSSINLWPAFHLISFLVPLISLGILLIVMICIKNSLSLNWLVGLRVNLAALGLLTFFIFLQTGTFMLLTEAMLIFLTTTAQILVSLVLVNVAFPYEYALVLACIPKVSLLDLFLMYPLHCLSSTLTTIFCAVGIILLAAISFYKIEKPLANASIPKQNRPWPVGLFHYGWLWFLVLPASFLCLQWGIILAMGYPCQYGGF